MTKYFNKGETILNRLKSFKHYVFLFNPDIKRYLLFQCSKQLL